MTEIKCNKCNKDILLFPPKMKAERKPGLNPYESALGIKDGFTEPKLCCPHCDEYLDEETLALIDSLWGG